MFFSWIYHPIHKIQRRPDAIERQSAADIAYRWQKIMEIFKE